MTACYGIEPVNKQNFNCCAVDSRERNNGIINEIQHFTVNDFQLIKIKQNWKFSSWYLKIQLCLDLYLESMHIRCFSWETAMKEFNMM